MITPNPVVSAVDILLALGVGPHHGAIDIEDGFREELRGLLGPDPQPGVVDEVHQGQDVPFLEAAAKVACSGGIGNALCAQSVEEDLIVAAQLDVLDALAPGQSVEGDVQDVIGFVLSSRFLLAFLSSRLCRLCRSRHLARIAVTTFSTQTRLPSGMLSVGSGEDARSERVTNSRRTTIRHHQAPTKNCESNPMRLATLALTLMVGQNGDARNRSSEPRVTPRVTRRDAGSVAQVFPRHGCDAVDAVDAT
jgi:hypothetical protein